MGPDNLTDAFCAYHDVKSAVETKCERIGKVTPEAIAVYVVKQTCSPRDA